VLGNTFGMLVLQDFEAMTPNLLARTIETVEGGGIIVFLLSSLDSLSKLYTLAMDCHARFRTESHQQVVPRFNERFMLSLANCRSCLLMDDELNILPTSSHAKSLKPVETDGVEVCARSRPSFRHSTQGQRGCCVQCPPLLTTLAPATSQWSNRRVWALFAR
jgi:tRNA(Met) C34 N-acetyltransferase TmcA